MRLLRAELEEARAERVRLRGQLENMARAYDEEQRRWIERTDDLRSELRKLDDIRKQKALLQGRYDSLQRRFERLDRWASELAEGYGPGIWIYNDELQRPLFEREARNPNVSGIVDELNEHFRRSGNPLLVLQGVDDRVAMLGVSDAARLTERMGSAGAISYIQTATYSLASLPDIDCVHFDFDEGSHAAPGKYCN